MRSGLKKKWMGLLFTAIMVFMMMGMTALAEEEADVPLLEMPLESSTVIEEGETFEDTEENLETSASAGYAAQIADSKKGIQGYEWMKAPDGANLGIKYTLLNLLCDSVMNGGTEEYVYNGATYTYNAAYMDGYISQVRKLNARGVTVSLVLLMRMDAAHQNLLYSPEPGHNYYACKADDPEVAEQLSALYSYIAMKLGQADCNVEQWILGNEVNVPEAYNWTGTADPETNVQLYAQNMVLLYNAVEAQNQAVPDKARSRVYASLDRGWNYNEGGKSIATKDFLNRFSSAMDMLQPGIDWGIAYHAYAVVMDPTVSGYTPEQISLWGNNPFTPNNEYAKFVTPANLSVLTEYVKNHFGSEHRIILSEQGFDAKGGEDYQAAALAYSFYVAQFNDMVDAVIYRALEDHPEEFGLQLGITGRKSYNVFKYMDTNIYGGETSSCLGTIGIGRWSDVISGFNMSGMEYRDVKADSWYAEPVYYVHNRQIMTGLNAQNFGAAENLGRGQFATILYRMESSPGVSFVSRFGDVQDGKFYSLPVEWGVQSGVIGGYENGNFGPADNITREQMAVMMYRYARYKGYDVSAYNDLGEFPDSGATSGFAQEAMRWAVGLGLIRGNADGTLCPTQGASRAAAATIIQRFLEVYGL